MKKRTILIIALLIVLSGCAAQTNKAEEPQASPSQAESAACAGKETSAEESEAAQETDAGRETEEAPKASTETEALKEPSTETEQTEAEDTMRLIIGETEVPVRWEDNASVEALKELSPITIQLSMYGGFEQVGPIGQSITREDQETHTSSGDIVLYSGNQIVIFYGSNSWAYTRLGHIDLSQKEMHRLLANGDVAITLEPAP